MSSVKSDTEVTRKRIEPDLVIRDPEYKPNYPQADNELLFSLMNIGAGVIECLKSICWLKNGSRK